PPTWRAGQPARYYRWRAGLPAKSDAAVAESWMMPPFSSARPPRREPRARSTHARITLCTCDLRRGCASARPKLSSRQPPPACARPWHTRSPQWSRCLDKAQSAPYRRERFKRLFEVSLAVRGGDDAAQTRGAFGHYGVGEGLGIDAQRAQL